MATKQTAPAQLPEPQAGGSYRREADGTLTLVQQTKPVHGRVQASREALEKRMGEGAQPAAGAPATTENKE